MRNLYAQKRHITTTQILKSKSLFKIPVEYKVRGSLEKLKTQVQNHLVKCIEIHPKGALQDSASHQLVVDWMSIDLGESVAPACGYHPSPLPPTMWRQLAVTKTDKKCQ